MSLALVDIADCSPVSGGKMTYKHRKSRILSSTVSTRATFNDDGMNITILLIWVSRHFQH